MAFDAPGEAPPPQNAPPGSFLIVPGAVPVPASVIGMPVTGVGTRSPQRRLQYTSKMDIGALNTSSVIVPLDGIDSIVTQLDSITISAAGTAFPGVSSGTVPHLQHQVSADGYRFTLLPSTTDITTEGISAQIPVSGWAFYRAFVTTKADTSCLCQITIQAKSNT